MTYSRFGKQILRDGENFAQAVSEQAAETILNALDALPVGSDYEDDTDQYEIDLVVDGPHVMRREGDEIVCSCGIRYDAKEDHP